MLPCPSGRSSAIGEDEGAAAVVAARCRPLWLRSRQTSGRKRHYPATRIVHTPTLASTNDNDLQIDPTLV
jgi:hypothetical protein